MLYDYIDLHIYTIYYILIYIKELCHKNNKNMKWYIFQD